MALAWVGRSCFTRGYPTGLVRLGRFGWGGAANTDWWIDPAEQLNCLIMLQYMPCFTIPIVEDFAQLAYQALE